MAGLESIALAVAHLEQETLKEHGGGDYSGNWGWQTTNEMPIPPRQPIVGRRVSSETCSPDEYEPTQISTSEGLNVNIGNDGDLIDALPPTLESLFEAEKGKPNIPTPDTTEDITEINDNDVLCGRGGETNHWLGNVRYRSLVKYYQRLYLEARRRDKPLIARVIVRTIRLRGGRFLKKDANSKFWKDVGNQRAREKTSQALREGAPDLRTNSGEDISQAQSVRNAKQRPNSESGSDEWLAEGESKTQNESGKRRRVSLEDFANIVAYSSSPELLDPACTKMPQFDVPTSSGDDDDSGSDQSIRSLRGPRLFILKQRLMHSEV